MEHLEPRLAMDASLYEIQIGLGTTTGRDDVAEFVRNYRRIMPRDPLDSASLVYHAQAYDIGNTVIPNEGTRTEPLCLGPTLGLDPQDPEFVDGYLRYDSDSHSQANVPPAVLNGELTLAIRYRPEALWDNRLLLSIVDGQFGKHFMLHQTPDNRYMSRFWEHPSVGWAQIPAASTTHATLGRTDTIVVTWDSDNVNNLYVNGVLESTGTTGKPRSDTTASPLQVPYPGTILYPAGRVYAIALWERALSASEIASLQTNEFSIP